MKYLIFSDIHANPVALKKVLSDAERYGAGKIVCAGDLTGYGPDPAGTLEIVRDRGIECVMGNHDAAIAGWCGPSGMNEYARNTYLRHRAELSRDDLDWLGGLPFVYEDGNIAVTHANFVDPQAMNYVTDRLDAQRSLIRREEQMLFVGHTHVEALYAFGIDSDPAFPDCVAREPDDFETTDGWRYLVNVGTAGYPRAKPYSTYVIYDSETGKVLFRRLEFDFDEYKRALCSKSLPVPEWM